MSTVIPRGPSPYLPVKRGLANPLRNPDMIVVHCSATLPKPTLGARDINSWHAQKGWMGIGYHYVIRADGTIEMGREEQMRGAHAEQVNDRSIGICMIGGVDEKGKPANNFTPAQFDSLAVLIADIRARHSIKEVIGHRDVPGVKKACPSFDVQVWLEERFTN